MSEYAKLKPFLKERSSNFTDDGQILDTVIPARYVEKFTCFITETKIIK